jgi:hypothetical protein
MERDKRRLYEKKWRDANREYQRKYRKVNKESITIQEREYRAANREMIKQKHKQWTDANKERVRAKKKDYYEANKEYFKEYRKRIPKDKRIEYRKTVTTEQVRKYNAVYRDYRNKRVKERKAIDPAFKLITNLRVRQYAVLKRKASTTKGLGCDSSFLKEYIEKQFTEGMSWDNYGNKEEQWSIDHIKPLSLYYDNPELLPELIHYTNLQPMWHIDNIKKKNKLVD